LNQLLEVLRSVGGDKQGLGLVREGGVGGVGEDRPDQLADLRPTVLAGREPVEGGRQPTCVRRLAAPLAALERDVTTGSHLPRRLEAGCGRVRMGWSLGGGGAALAWGALRGRSVLRRPPLRRCLLGRSLLGPGLLRRTRPRAASARALLGRS